ncbi:diguanylate cyclase (GGDEF)-like protein [Deinococcus metalli]|uniref:Diguanylate cyclase (GGDEF)-like protein n=1 Tax=Deinococcus metalli TaxID=1141878 RepID=A0A7W8KCI7_9DEIO|nr:EAL domain-containing protein [Deinococcus metalli]MBB5375677.1 diguanylate cyclase (GGDEF)-like protein [Deinococcus metalli]GHF37856.1 GGDEF domain-containing protein [Deinococcus metalli]
MESSPGGAGHAARAAVLETFRSSADPLAVLDALTLDVLLITAELERRLALPASVLLGQSFAALTAPADRDEVHAGVAAFAQGGAALPRRSFDLMTGDGAALPCDLHGTRLTLPGGQAVVVLTLEPVAAPQRELAFSGQVLASLPTELAVLDAQGRYLYCNPAAVGDPQVRAQIVGKTDREFVAWRGYPQRVAERREEHFRRALDERATVHWEELFPTPNGHRVVRRAYTPVFRADGSLDVMIGFGSDITQSMEQTRRLTLLETMVSTSLDALMVINVCPGDAYLTMEYGNPALYALLRRHGLHDLEDVPLHRWPFGVRDLAAINDLRARLTRQHTGGQRGGTYVLFLPDLREWLELTASPILDAARTCTHWAVDLRIVTDRHRAQDVQLRLVEANLLALRGRPLDVSVMAMLGGVEVWHPGWRAAVVFADAGALRVLGDAPASLQATLEDTAPAFLRELWQRRDPDRTGRPLVFHNLPAQLDGRLDPAQIARLGVSSTAELALYDQDGGMLGVLFAAHETQEDVPEGLTDLLELRAPALALLLERDVQRRQLEQLAYTDPLTGLMNRWTFSTRLDWELRRVAQEGGQLALGLIDLDRFKQVNDGLGHPTADELLRLLAGRLTTLAQRHDLLALARMGGDEFAFLLSDPGQMPAMVQDLRSVFDQPFELASGPPLLLQASVGWSVAPDTAPDAETLHRQADAAMYQAKRQQRFSHVFEPTVRSGIQALTLETAMRQALPRREFRLVYQPQVGSSTGELYGAEALLRWTNPTLGVITPDQFIPVAELTGLMGGLGAWVLDTACRDAAGWANPRLTVSVNVSSTQLQDAQFEHHVRRALERSGLDPHRLVLEVTETGLIDNPASARAMLQALRDEGVRISIDDFGTGYSTLHSLRTLPVDELKIDRAFIRDIGEPSQGGWESRAIMRATLQLAHALDMAVVAEGVEHQAQADALREVGCDLHQGWLIAPGLDGADFERFVQDWSARLAGTSPRSASMLTPPH